MNGQDTAESLGQHLATFPQRGQKTHRMTMATSAMIQDTAQLLPVHILEMPMNLSMMRASQKMGSMELRMRLAFRLLHLANRSVCSVRSW